MERATGPWRRATRPPPGVRPARPVGFARPRPSWARGRAQLQPGRRRSPRISTAAGRFRRNDAFGSGAHAAREPLAAARRQLHSTDLHHTVPCGREWCYEGLGGPPQSAGQRPALPIPTAGFRLSPNSEVGRGAHAARVPVWAARPNLRSLTHSPLPETSEWNEVFGGPPKTARQRRALPALGGLRPPPTSEFRLSPRPARRPWRPRLVC